jgi:anti-sigma-K factor RskA
VNCQERRDQLLLYALGGLDSAESEALRAHLATGCPTCAGSLAEAEATVSSLPEALEPMTPPARVLDRLMEQVKNSPRAARTADAETNRTAAVRLRPMQSRTWAALLALATSVLLMVGIAYQQVRIVQQQKDLQKAIDQVASLRNDTQQLKGQSADLQQQLAAATQTIQVLQSKNVRLVSLAGAEAQPDAFGQILWDEQKRQWHVFFSGMKPAGVGKTYELWFVTSDGKKVPAGLFDADPNGRAALSVGLPPDLGMLAMAAVTDEPISGSPQPTGNFQLVGQIN